MTDQDTNPEERFAVIDDAKLFADRFLEKKTMPLNFIDVPLTAEPAKVYDELNNTGFNDLLLQPGDSLSVEPSDDDYPEIDVRVKQKPDSAFLRAWGWDFEDGSWAREIDFIFVYKGEEDVGHQDLSIYVSKSGGMTLTRNVWASAYAETGYEGHNQKDRPETKPSDIENFLGFVRQYTVQVA